jgi:hypothetical protein
LYFFRLPGGPRNKTPKNRNAFDGEDEDDEDVVFPDPVAQGNVVQKMNNTIFALIIII